MLNVQVDKCELEDYKCDKCKKFLGKVKAHKLFFCPRLTFVLPRIVQVHEVA